MIHAHTIVMSQERTAALHAHATALSQLVLSEEHAQFLQEVAVVMAGAIADGNGRYRAELVGIASNAVELPVCLATVRISDLSDVLHAHRAVSTVVDDPVHAEQITAIEQQISNTHALIAAVAKEWAASGFPPNQELLGNVYVSDVMRAT